MDNRNFIAKRAAAYFRPGDVVNLGIGIPSLCGSYAVDGVLFQSENGFIGIGPTVQEGLMKNERFVNAGGVPFVPVPGSSAFDVAMSFNVIRCGRLAATVLGGLQVSAQGDLANWATPGRAFGMGGAMDLCNGARKVIVAMELVATAAPQPKTLNLASVMTSSSTRRVICMMSPHFGFPATPTASACSMAPKLRG